MTSSSRRETSGAGVAKVLICFTFALAAAGPILDIGGAPISPSQLIAILLISHFVLVQVGRHEPEVSRYAAAMSIGAVLLGIGVLSAAVLSSAAAAFLNFISGALAAVVIGIYLSQPRSPRLDLPDLGLIVFVLGSAYQQQIGGGNTTSNAQLHASVLVAWGGSNYVGVVMVVVGFWLLARATQLENGRWILYAVVLAGFVTAVSTLSRGAVISLTAGLLLLTWRSGKTRFQRVLFRSAILAVPWIAIRLMEGVVSARFEGTSADPSSNIDVRFVLYRAAWNQFLSSPLVGTGWTGLRHSEASAGTISYAHNWYLSALQIAGLCALPILIVFTLATITVIRRGELIGSAVVAAMAATMFEPVLEGYVGSLVMISVVLIGASRSGVVAVAALRSREIEPPVRETQPRRSAR